MLLQDKFILDSKTAHSFLTERLKKYVKLTGFDPGSNRQRASVFYHHSPTSTLLYRSILKAGAEHWFISNNAVYMSAYETRNERLNDHYMAPCTDPFHFYSRNYQVNISKYQLFYLIIMKLMYLRKKECRLDWSVAFQKASI